MSTGSKGLLLKQERTADTHLLGIGHLALSGALPGHEQVLRCSVSRITAAFVFRDLDEEYLETRVIRVAHGGKG